MSRDVAMQSLIWKILY